MKYLIKPHARRRLEERLIPERLIREALESPDKVGYDGKGRWLVKKIYKRHDSERLILIAGEFVDDTFEIITVIETSKVKKYL